MSDEEGNVVDLNTQILISIRDEITTMRTELRSEISGLRTGLRDEISGLRTELRDEIAGVGGRIATLEAETIRGFTGVRHELDRVNKRLDNLVDITGSGHRDHEARISALEGAVSRLSGR